MNRIGPLEYAVTAFADGSTPNRSEALRRVEAYKAALRAAGGRPPVSPRNGRPQVWNASLGWHDNDRDPELEALARHLSVPARAIYEHRRRERRDRTLVADVALGRRRPSLATNEARQRLAEWDIAMDRLRGR